MNSSLSPGCFENSGLGVETLGQGVFCHLTNNEMTFFCGSFQHLAAMFVFWQSEAVVHCHLKVDKVLGVMLGIIFFLALKLMCYMHVLNCYHCRVLQEL